MWHDNEFTKKLKVKYPIIQAGMAGGVTTPKLVAAVSNAGGLGSIGAGYMDALQLREHIQEVKKLTNNPFAVNLFTPQVYDVSEERIEKTDARLQPFRDHLHISERTRIDKATDSLFLEQIELIIEEELSICSFTFGIPSIEIIQRLKSRNMVLIGTATTVEEAVANENNGMDMVVMQGSEAGGHRGSFIKPFEDAMIGTMALVPQATDAVTIPVIAAGGIADGRGLVAALVLGAQAVQMGTAFVTSFESGVIDAYKEAIVNSHEDQTVVTSVFSGKPARGIKNEFISDMMAYEEELPDYPLQNSLTNSIRSEAAKQNKTEWMSLWCGQNPRLTKQQSASQTILELITQAESIMKKS